MSTQYETQGYTINNAGRRLVVDPITRIEGHMRCEVNINDQNVITNAVSCGTMFRGLEIILQGRDPRDAWAFVERICGVCTGVHALASVYAIEDAIGIKVPDNANIIRNIMLATLWCHDHLVHFYQLAGMDWIDVLDALKADPRKTSELAQSLSSWPKSSPGYFFDVQNRLKKFVEGGQLGIFRNGYWGHPQYKLPPEALPTISKLSISSVKLSKSTRSLAVKTRIQTGLSAGCLAPSTLTKAARSGQSIWNA